MTVRFVRIRIAGFKSFADPVTVEILPGLTGIVGPNGCGKSNVVEALRWVMGESSARSLRGGELDDLIFAGTTSRAARALAEVTVTLEGTQGLGPAAFADQDELQITRRAERGAGSEYRINGKVCRARDVQTLFADLASGARSSAMVSQGRVAMLVGARPEERRVILEEAAGITGLHARRHEAELKLRATESNLTRAEDLRQQLSTRLDGLAEQSREASRYRELSAGLREAETELLAVLHARARQAVERALETASRARKALTEQADAAETAVIAEYEATQALPAIREKADTARTILERYRVTAEGVAREEQRAAAQAQAASERLNQHHSDFTAAQTRVDDAAATLERLQAEQQATDAAIASLPTRTAEADERYTTLTADLAEAEQTLASLTSTLNTARDTHNRAQDALVAAQTRHTRSAEALASLQTELHSLQSRLPSEADKQQAQTALESTSDAQNATRTALEEAERTRSQARVALSIAQNDAENARKTQSEATKALEQARNRLATLRRDLTELEKRHTETVASLLSAETLASLHSTAAEATTAYQSAQQSLDTAAAQRRDTSDALTETTRLFQTDEAQRKTIAEAKRAAETALQRARQEEVTLNRGLEQATKDAIPDSVLETAQNKRATLEADLKTLTTTLEAADAQLATLKATQQDAVTERDTLRTEITRLKAQAEGLAHALGDEAEASAEPVSAQMDVPEGYEAALAAALSEGLDAPVAENAPRGWHTLKGQTPPPALPAQAKPLSAFITAPAVLTHLLGFVGLLPDGQDGSALQAGLHPGQSLVSRQGDLWRWDGFYTRAGEPDAATRRLGQRRILKETEQRLADLAQKAPAVEQAAVSASQAVQQQDGIAAQHRAERAKLEQSLQHARTQEAETQRRHAASRARLDTLRPQHERAIGACADADAALAAAMQAQAGLPSPDALRTALQTAHQQDTTAQEAEQKARSALKTAEHALQTANSALSKAENQQATATARLETLLPERDRLRQNVATEDATLQELETRVAAGQSNRQFEEALLAAQTHQADSSTAYQSAEQALSVADKAAEEARSAHQALQQQTLELQSRLDALAPRLAELTTETQELAAHQEQAAKTLAEAAASIPATADADIAAQQDKRTQILSTLETLRELRAALLAEKTTLAHQQTTLATSVTDWTARAAAARAELEQATTRLDAARTEHLSVSELPAEAERQKQTTLKALHDAESAFAEADRARAQAEATLTAANEQRRKTEAELAAAREAVLKAEGKSEQAQAILDQLLAETPEPPRRPMGEITDSAESSLRRKISRLTREREDLGPVNLRAEIEAEEASTQANTLAAEIADLEAAIARLRGSIGSLNKEGRERLMVVFTQVDHHFQSLFSRMFGGGRAHLGLVGSDDPLEAGLEIYAQPPGKKLATLSLLSGGEQALTALSLIFAVFRCNPAPVCVLDEVDAPLDDANVGRFSALLGDMVTEAGTRFLVVTHHQLTMAHMDHLFGVTMQERGVSRVLSVDLARAAAMAGQQDRETPDVASI